ncbi:CHAD domain-containing protein [Microbacterium sp. P07]|uniref:CHAD domain-containing protein n=1 Tax=Microbacterium sp. P07 TaxID=3366952 RepID=UPI0037463CD1
MATPENTLDEVVRTMIRTAAGRVLDTEQAALADEPDGVHRHRTRVRRFRSILAMLGDQLEPGPTQRVRGQLREWGTQLGTVRDAEVVAAETDAAMKAEGIDDEALRRRLVDEPLAEYARRHARLVRLRDQPRAEARMRDLHTFAAHPPLVDTDLDAVTAFTAVLRKEVRRVKKAASRLDGSLESLHDVRKAGRRLRYAAEAVVAAGPASLADAAAVAAKAGSHLHDVLGGHRDAVALAERLDRARVRASRAGESVAGYERMMATAVERADARLSQLDDALAQVRAASAALS